MCLAGGPGSAGCGDALIVFGNRRTSAFVFRRHIVSLANRLSMLFARSLEAMLEPRLIGTSRLRLFGYIALVLGCASLALIRVWLRNDNVNLSIAGFYEVSDASGYVACAYRVLDYGTFDLPWCDRRALYPVMLATLSALVGREWFATLLLQTAFVSLSLFTLVRATSRSLGPLAAAFLFLLLLGYASFHAFPQAMTENAGLAFGLLGTALLLVGTEPQLSKLRIFVGTALLSIGLVARAGPFFILPALFCWALIESWRRGRNSWWLIPVVLSGLLVGPAVQVLATMLTGGDLRMLQGNFSYTLYGLATGGRSWGAVLDDYPELRSLLVVDEAAGTKKIYALAIQKLLEGPLPFIHALWQGLRMYTRSPVFPSEQYLSGWSSVLWWLGWVAIIVKRRQACHALIGWLNVGVVLSAPFIVYDGGARVFAAAAGITVVQAALGLRTVLQASLFAIAAIRPGWSSKPWTAVPAVSTKYEGALAVALVSLIAMPVTPLRQAFASTALPAGGCTENLRAVVAHLGNDSQYLSIVADATPQDALKGKVAFQRLERRGIQMTWFFDEVLALPKPITMVHAWPLNQDARGGTVNFFWTGDLSPYQHKTVLACVDPSQAVALAQVPYWRARSVTPLD